MSFGLNLVNQHARMHDLQVFAQCLLAAPVTGDNPWTNLIPYNGCVGQSPVEHNHQLESRMRESRLSGSEGGAILISRPYPYPYPRHRIAPGSKSLRANTLG
jgi:hypothetical protein